MTLLIKMQSFVYKQKIMMLKVFKSVPSFKNKYRHINIWDMKFKVVFVPSLIIMLILATCKRFFSKSS